MLGVGWTEMLVIGVVALIVIGPKELPAVMHRVGRFAATIRRMGSDFQRELNKTTGLDEVKNLRNAITQPLKQTTDAIRREFNTVSSTGAVTPSGALKPADPKAESVVDEIRAAAGMTPAEPVKAAPTPTMAESMKAAVTAKVAGPAKEAIAPSTAAPPAVRAQAAKPKRAPAKRKTAPKEAASAAPVEAKAAPAAEPKPKRTRKPAAKKA